MQYIKKLKISFSNVSVLSILYQIISIWFCKHFVDRISIAVNKRRIKNF